MEEVGNGCFLNGNVGFLIKMSVFCEEFSLNLTVIKIQTGAEKLN